MTGSRHRAEDGAAEKGHVHFGPAWREDPVLFAPDHKGVLRDAEQQCIDLLTADDAPGDPRDCTGREW